MITHTPPVADYLPIKTLVAKLGNGKHSRFLVEDLHCLHTIHNVMQHLVYYMYYSCLTLQTPCMPTI